jgi:predicted nuclease of restriction endonuclease-like (RecB) superfamily
MNQIRQSDYKSFVKEIKKKIYEAQYKALKAVNLELISLNWDIGKSIIEKQEQLGWGKSVVETLSKDLQKEFPGIHGYSSQNLWRMRRFYLVYQDNTKLAPMVREIGWSHNIAIFEKCIDDLQREFYIRMTKKYGWTKNVLIHQIESEAYERYLLNQTNFDKALEEKCRHQANLAVKDSYNFDFLELDKEYDERKLELGLIKNVQSFLLEMGGDFSFIGNQFMLDVDGDEFFIDLLLYHRRLKCLVAIELKTTDFIPEYTGKMQFYLSVLDDKVRQGDENPSIGIVICKTKRRTVVEYALKNTGSPMGVADYSLSRTLPKTLKGLLPTSTEIIERLSHLTIQ